MDKAKEALKAELLELYSQALDEVLEACPEREDFAVLEERVEQLATQTLPETLSRLAQAKGIFPPKLPRVRPEAAEER
jgi:hypothetical protein